MELLTAADMGPSVLVLAVGLVLLIRRRRDPIAIAGAAVLLADALGRGLLGIVAYRHLAAGVLDLPGWMEVADLALLPADLLGLPLLVWAILAGRRPRPAAAPA